MGPLGVMIALPLIKHAIDAQIQQGKDLWSWWQGDKKGKKGGKGEKGNVERIELFNKEQKKIMDQMGQQGKSGIDALLKQPPTQFPKNPAPIDLQQQMKPQPPVNLQNLFGNRPNVDLSNVVSPYKFDFAPIEAQARSDFSSKTIPSLAERFTALGSGGSQKSSAFQGALGGAAKDLETQLAALRAQYGLQGNDQNARHALQQAQLQLGQQGQFGREAVAGAQLGLSQRGQLSDEQARLAQMQMAQQGQQFGYGQARSQFTEQQGAQQAALFQNLLAGGLGQQFHPVYTPPPAPQQGFMSSLAQGAGQAGGQLGSMYMMQHLLGGGGAGGLPPII